MLGSVCTLNPHLNSDGNRLAATTGSKLSLKMKYPHNVPRKAALPLSSWMERVWSPRSQPRTWSDYHHVILAALNLDPTIGRRKSGNPATAGYTAGGIFSLPLLALDRSANQATVFEGSAKRGGIYFKCSHHQVVHHMLIRCLPKIGNVLKDLLSNFT
jgi:hypothetical protein